MTNSKAAMNIREFADAMNIYFEIAAKKYEGAAWLCSLRSKLRLNREEFNALAPAAHRAGLIELSRCDLRSDAEERFLVESVIEVGHYEFHLMRK